MSLISFPALLLLLAICSHLAAALKFTPTVTRFNYLQTRKISRLHFSDFERPNFEKKPEVKATDAVEETSAKSNAANDEEERREISDAMRQKLRRELISQGADPNFSRGPVLGNPILLISLLVAVLVIAGGKDVFY